MTSAYASAGFDWSDTPYECRHDDNDEDNADSADKKKQNVLKGYNYYD